MLNSRMRLRIPGRIDAGVAQLVEHLICNQRVGGSNPSASSNRPIMLRIPAANPQLRFLI